LKDSVNESIDLKSYLTAFIGSRMYAKEDKKVEITIDCPDQEARISLNKSYLVIMGLVFLLKRKKKYLINFTRLKDILPAMSRVQVWVLPW